MTPTASSSAVGWLSFDSGEVSSNCTSFRADCHTRSNRSRYRFVVSKGTLRLLWDRVPCSQRDVVLVSAAHVQLQRFVSLSASLYVCLYVYVDCVTFVFYVNIAKYIIKLFVF